MSKKSKGKLKSDRDYSTDPDDDYVPSSEEEQEPSPASIKQEEVEFKLEISSSTSEENSSDDDSKCVLLRKEKRRRSDPRAQGKSHDLERKARGENYMTKSPPKKKQMTKLSVDTKLYQGQRELKAQTKAKEAEKKEKALYREQRKLDRQKKQLQKEKQAAEKQAAKEAKQHWKNTASKSRLSSKRKPTLKTPTLGQETDDDSDEDDDDDDSVEYLGMSPVASKAANRLMSAKAGTSKIPVKPDKAASSQSSREESSKTTVSGSNLLDEIKKDTLNQSRAVKRHSAAQTKMIISRLDNQDILLRDLLQSVNEITHPTSDPADLALANLNQHRQLIERMTAQDGVLNDLQTQLPRMIKRVKKTVDQIYEIVKQCPHNDGKKTPTTVPPSVATLPTNESDSVANNTNTTNTIHPTITVRHQYFQHSQAGGHSQGTETHHSTTAAARITQNVVNPYKPPSNLSIQGKENLQQQEKRRIKPTPVNPNQLYSWPNTTGSSVLGSMPPPRAPQASQVQAPALEQQQPPPPPTAPRGGFQTADV